MFGIKIGQFGINNIVMGIVGIIVLAVLLPVMITFLPTIADPSLQMIINLLPIILCLSFIIGLIWHAIPTREVVQ